MRITFKTIFFILSALMLLIIFSSCAERFELTVSSSDGGSVTMEPAGGLYKEGEAITLTATEDSGFSFTGWGNITDYSADYSSDKSIEIIMPAMSLDVSALFSVPNEGWTFMVYMAGDNSLSSYVSTDINEIEQGLYDAVNSGNSLIDGVVRVLVLADRSSSNDTMLYLVEPDNTTAVVSPELSVEFNSGGELNMADPDTLKDFVSYSLATFPSEYNALVIWNHGGGVRSLEEPSGQISKILCEDGSDIMYTDEMQKALLSALGSSSLNIFGIDACIMGEVETAYEFRNIADYFVASMAEEWGYGWGYEHIFDKFTSAGSPPAPAEMADILVSQFYESTNGENSYYPNTMTAVNTAELADLKTAIDELAAEIHIHGAGTEAQDAFQSARDDSVFYYEPRPAGESFNDSDDDDYEAVILSYPYYDLYDFCLNLQTSFGASSVYTKADAVLSALDTAVIATYGNSAFVDSYYSGSRDALDLSYYETDDSTAVRGLSILIPHGELSWESDGVDYSHYAFDWWYISDTLSQYSPSQGGIDFCTYDSDGTVDTWRELFEAWYDDYAVNSGEGYTGGTY